MDRSSLEFNYAFMGGSLEYTYPWGNTAPGSNTSLVVYGCYYPAGADGNCSGVQNIAPVGSVPAGNGLWGQSDLAGEMMQWMLDLWKSPYSTWTCDDCADTTDTSAVYRVARGSDFSATATWLPAANRSDFVLTLRDFQQGFRCARTP
jgi:formylglycine-generating enzyme required for sulfatase activity